MVDRQDIDALLISALYGELTPADEARLTTHLESHPADKSALGLLTETRAAFRASGFAGVQVDPPQAISALLLQEAARRAPKVVAPPRDEEKVGWFQRFVNSFARHPAMAAAATIVLVAGIGGLIYSHQGKGSFAEQTFDERAPSAAVSAGSAAATPMMPTTPPMAASDAALAPSLDPSVAYGSGSAALNYDKLDSYRVDLADGNAAKGGKAAPSDHAGIVVNTPQPQPKELAEGDKTQLAMRAMEKQKAKDEQASVAKADSPKKAPAASKVEAAPGRFETTTTTAGSGYANGESKNAVVGGAGGGQGAVAPAPDAKAPMPPPPPTQVANNNNATDATVLAWAHDQHKRVLDYVHQNNCVDAAKVAAQISARANDYYNQNVATDRGLKACQAYINDQRSRDAERTQKAAAQKRVDANEVQPAPANVK